MDPTATVTAAVPSDGKPTAPPPSSGAREARREATRSAFLSGESVAAEPGDKPPAEAEQAAPTEQAEQVTEPEAKESQEAKPEQTEGDKKPSIDDLLEQKQKEREEQRASDMLAKVKREHEAEIAKLREELAPQSKEYQEFTKLKSSARSNLPAVLEALGISREEFGLHAKQLYRLSPEAAKDPKNREAYERDAAVREAMEAAKRAEARAEELEKTYKQREEERAVQQAIGSYLDQVQKAASAETPLMSKWIERNPHAARQRIHEVAAHLAEQLGEPADAADVIKYVEKLRRQEFIDAGIDPDAGLAASTQAKTENQSAGETKTAPTLSSDLGTPTKPRSDKPKSREERRLEFIQQAEGRTG